MSHNHRGQLLSTPYDATCDGITNGPVRPKIESSALVVVVVVVATPTITAASASVAQLLQGLIRADNWAISAQTESMEFYADQRAALVQIVQQKLCSKSMGTTVTDFDVE